MFTIQLDFKGVLSNSIKQVLKNQEHLSIFLSNTKAKCVFQRCGTHIREQMCLETRETHFRYENSILSHFGQWGAAEREKIQTAISMLLLRAVFLCFHFQNCFFFKCCSVRTKKLHKMKLKKI